MKNACAFGFKGRAFQNTFTGWSRRSTSTQSPALVATATFQPPTSSKGGHRSHSHLRSVQPVSWQGMLPLRLGTGVLFQGVEPPPLAAREQAGHSSMSESELVFPGVGGGGTQVSAKMTWEELSNSAVILWQGNCLTSWGWGVGWGGEITNDQWVYRFYIKVMPCLSWLHLQSPGKRIDTFLPLTL